MAQLNSLFAAGTYTYVLDAPTSNSGIPTKLEALLETIVANERSNQWTIFSNDAYSKTFVACVEACREKPFPIQDMIFLVCNSYITVTFKFVVGDGDFETLRDAFEPSSSSLNPAHYTARVITRVYLIPQDLPGMRGRLQGRSAQKVEKPAMKILPTLLDTICRCPNAWLGRPADPHCRPIGIFQIPNLSSLLDMFNNLSCSEFGNAPDDPFLRTRLYGYQRQSVSAMQQMELSGYVPDPLFIQVTDMDNEVFFLQPSTLELRREQPIMARGRGGFLSEELGSGKTLMILALILSDLNVLPSPPDDFLTTSRVLTPLSLRHFPFAHCEESRMLLPAQRNSGGQSSSGRLPSLVELCLDSIRTSRDGYDLQKTSDFRSNFSTTYPSSLEEKLEQLSLLEPFQHNIPFFLQSRSTLGDTSRDSRARQLAHHAPRVVFLSPATIIVVPPNLVSQWEGQILLHCSRNIRVLVVKGDASLPPPQQLASNYDIIIIASTWLSKVFRSEKLRIQPGFSCKCPSYSSSVRVPICHCHENASQYSPLLQVMFKRLVRDEGHNTAASTDLNLFCKDILANSRWIVTGTPTVNLLGLNLGKDQEDSLPNPLDNQPGELDLLAAFQLDAPSPGHGDTSFDADLLDVGEDSGPKSPSSIIGVDFEDQAPPADTRVWSNDERADLKILGSMLGGYLMVERFSSGSVFEKLVIDSLFPQSHQLLEDGKKLKRSPVPGAVQVLCQIMKMYMVRHLVQEIEAEHPLPPMTQETIFLELLPHAAMTFNVIQSTIAVNAVDSERVDQDYLFHADNRAALNEVMANLTQALFWHRDEEFFDSQLQDQLRNAAGAIDRAKTRGQSLESIQIVEGAVAQIKSAYVDATFRAMHHLLEIPYNIMGLPANIKPALDSVARVHDDTIPQSEFLHDENTPCLITPSHAIDLRDGIERRPLMSQKDLVELAELVHGDERRRNAILAAKNSRKRAMAKKKKAPKSAGDAASAEELAGRTKHQEKVLEEMRKEYELAQARRRELTGGGSVAGGGLKHSETNEMSHARRKMLQDSQLGSARVLSCLSSKLNYILKEIQEYSASEKFLIFSKQPLNLVHIAEGLDLLGIKYLDYRSRTTKERGLNAQNLMTFETSDVFRVFLMELRHGARGLNIISASRVIFCEPVWRPDVESQAIKRAHRIGQTRPVTVKTLAIKSTFEEFMLQRRRELNESDSGKLRGSMTEEAGMQHYLKNPTFLQTSKTESDIVLDLPLLRIPNAPMETARADTPDVSRCAVDQQMGCIEIEPDRSWMRKIKKVRLIVRDPEDYSEGRSEKKVRFG